MTNKVVKKKAKNMTQKKEIKGWPKKLQTSPLQHTQTMIAFRK
jgi:hypothetical protein